MDSDSCGRYWGKVQQRATGLICLVIQAPPLPVAYLRQILPMYCDVLLVLQQLVTDRLLGIRGACTELWNAVNHVRDKVEAVQIIEHCHVEGRGGCAFFLVAAHVQIVMSRTAIGEPVDQPWIAMEGEDDWLVPREQHIEFPI